MARPTLGHMAYLSRQGPRYSPTPVAPGGGSAIVCDATVNYSGSYKGDCTKQPVSDKTDRTDHYRVVNPSFTIKGGMSTATLGIYGWEWQPGSGTRVGTYVDEIRDIIFNKELVSVFMPNGIIANNCVIVDATFSKTAPNGNYLEVSLSIEQLQVITDDVGLESLSSTSSAGAGNSGNAGGDFGNRPSVSIPPSISAPGSLP